MTYEHWGVNALVVMGTAIAVALAVLLHYEGLALLSRRLVHVHGQRRRKVLVGVYGVILLHVAEIWLFGVVFWLLLLLPEAGALSTVPQPAFLDAVYLSAETFSTVGYGDLAPQGAIRFLAGTEALTGFILITWSASFLYLEMEQYWRRPGG
jgi:hypothetical protein